MDEFRVRVKLEVGVDGKVADVAQNLDRETFQTLKKLTIEEATRALRGFGFHLLHMDGSMVQFEILLKPEGAKEERPLLPQEEDLRLKQKRKSQLLTPPNFGEGE